MSFDEWNFENKFHSTKGFLPEIFRLIAQEQKCFLIRILLTAMVKIHNDFRISKIKT